MEEKRQKNSRKRLNSLILLVAFTAIMLIVSTYAWFSAQRNVSISNLEGTVNVVEGLEISLDALHWSQAVDLGAAMSNAETSGYFSDGYDLETPYADGANILPSELIPVSTTGASTDGIGATDMKMFRGINVNGRDLYSIQQTDSTVTSTTDNKFPGYYAIDFFLKNTSADGAVSDKLLLNINSELKLLDSQLNTTGLQNTVRVAFALYNTTLTDASDTSVDVVKGTQSTILTATAASNQTIKDVAIWEPNSNAHVSDIVTNNNKITWSTTDAGALWGSSSDTNHKFTATDKIPTYALTTASLSATSNVVVGPNDTQQGIVDIYNWDGTTNASLKKQVTQQTNTGALAAETDLISVTTTDLSSPTDFVIPANQVCRLRMYVWLEGQDVDCVNLASHGGGVHLDLGILKPSSNNS